MARNRARYRDTGGSQLTTAPAVPARALPRRGSRTGADRSSARPASGWVGGAGSRVPLAGTWRGCPVGQKAGRREGSGTGRRAGMVAAELWVIPGVALSRVAAAPVPELAGDAGSAWAPVPVGRAADVRARPRKLPGSPGLRQVRVRQGRAGHARVRRDVGGRGHGRRPVLSAPRGAPVPTPPDLGRTLAQPHRAPDRHATATPFIAGATT